MTVSFEKRKTTFEKYDDEHRIAYGWAIVSTEGGKPYFDLQGDHIPMDVVVKASIDFMKSSRASDDMHREVKTGDVIYCAPVTKGMLVDPTAPDREGLWIGVQIHDDAVYKATKSGARGGFSIGGFLDEADYIGTNTTKARGANLREADEAFVKRITKGAKPQRIFRSMRLAFVSTVDRPAQEPALISIVKRAPDAGSIVWMRKGVAFTSEDAGHQHMVDSSCFNSDGSGSTCSAQTGGANSVWHSHDLIRDTDDGGVIEIGANAGHSHTLDAEAIGDLAPVPQLDSGDDITTTVEISPTSKNSPDPNSVYVAGEMGGEKKKPKKPGDKTKPEETSNKGLVLKTNSALGCADKERSPMDIEQLKKMNADLTSERDAEIAKRKTAECVAELPDSQRVYYAKLAPTDAASFLAKSAVDRKTELDSQIAHTSPDGTVYYKFEDAKLVALAKRADDAEKTSVEDRALAKRANFAKMASEKLGKAFTGDEAVQIAVVAAIESITDPEVKKNAWAMIDGARTAMIAKQKQHGTTPMIKAAAEGGAPGGESGENPISKARNDLRTAVTEYAKVHSLQYEAAFAKATGSDPHIRSLYEQMRNEERSN